MLIVSSYLYAQVHALLELFDEAAAPAAEPAAIATADTGDRWDAQAALQQPLRKRQRTGKIVVSVVVRGTCIGGPVCSANGVASATRARRLAEVSLSRSYISDYSLNMALRVHER